MRTPLNSITQKVIEKSRCYRDGDDRLRSFSELLCKFKEAERGEPSADFSRELQFRGSPTCIISLHGGNLERGTAELTADLAGEQHSFYIFRSHLPIEADQLWLTSTKFDDPALLDLLSKSKRVLSIHGCEDPIPGSPPALLYVGGRDKDGKKTIMNALRSAGIPCFIDRVFPGLHPRNPCNLGQSGAGVQLELTHSFREQLLSHYRQSSRKDCSNGVVLAFLDVMREFLSVPR